MHGWPCSLYEAIVALRKQSFLNLLRQNGCRVTKVYRLVMYRLVIVKKMAACLVFLAPWLFQTASITNHY